MNLGWLAALFFMTAALYASVGFGGGSTYTALLIMAGTPRLLVPVISLACNILVVSGNTTNYWRDGLYKTGKYIPLIILSIPMAWLGGWLNISETLFIGLLWVALLLAGLRLLLSKPQTEVTEIRKMPFWQSAIIGGFIGLYSGLAGIGGGIFLAPILYFTRWGRAREIAAACSLFILVNSISGLAGQLTKLTDLDMLGQVWTYWPVLPAVLIGGFIGNRFAALKISELWLKRLTAILILSAALRLGFEWVLLITA